jgi:hypothetical protein
MSDLVDDVTPERLAIRYEFDVLDAEEIAEALLRVAACATETAERISPIVGDNEPLVAT